MFGVPEKPSGILITDVTGNIGGTTGIRTEDILSQSTKFNENEFYGKYITIENDSVFLDISIILSDTFNLQSFQKMLMGCIDKIYAEGYYFKGLQISLLEDILYGDIETLISITKLNNEKIKIAQEIEKVPFERNIQELLYGGDIIMLRDGSEATFTMNSYERIKIMLGENALTNEEYSTFSGAICHAYLWNNYTIRFHSNNSPLYSLNGIQRSSQKNPKIVFRGRRTTETFHDYVEEKVLLKIKRTPLLGTDGKLDYTTFTCAFPQAKLGQTIVEVVYGVAGKSGIGLNGERIEPEAVKRIQPLSLLEDSKNSFIQVNEIQGRSQIIALEDVYITTKSGKYGFSREMKYSGIVGSSSSHGIGNIHLPDNTVFIFHGEVQNGYHISAYRIVYSGNLYGKINVTQDAKVTNGSILGGQIVSESGNISIDKGARVQNHSLIQALNGKVVISGDIEKTTIMADEIEIEGCAYDCILIGKNIKLHKNRGSKIMAESISLGEDLSPNTSEYTLLVYSSTERIISLAVRKGSVLEEEGKKLYNERDRLGGELSKLTDAPGTKNPILEAEIQKINSKIATYLTVKERLEKLSS